MPDLTDDFDRLMERMGQEAKTPIEPTTFFLSPRQYREAQACGGIDKWMRKLWAEVRGNHA